MEEIIAVKFAALNQEWNERQRRLWAASEALCLGYGGVSLVSRATGLSRTTLHLGIRELESGDTLSKHRVRRVGGGRKKVKDIQPTRADTLDGGTNSDRNAQFEFINAQATTFLKQGCPVISVDAKKKELIGPVSENTDKQNGRVWRPKGKPELVKVYDFIDKKLGKATPYGIYDLQKNVGWVNVGIDHDTAEFADETGLTIHVSHFPPGTSKWNKIELRLFNHISMNWKGQPLCQSGCDHQFDWSYNEPNRMESLHHGKP